MAPLDTTTLHVPNVILDGSAIELCPRCAGSGSVNVTERPPFGCMGRSDFAAFHERQRREAVPCDCGAWDWRRGPKPVQGVEAGRVAA